MSKYIIPDIFRLVLEYSEYKDRKVWSFSEDTGMIYENISLDIHNIVDSHRMLNITICNLYEITNTSITDFPNVHTLAIDKLSTTNTSLHIFPKLTTVYIFGWHDTRFYISDIPEHIKISRLHLPGMSFYAPSWGRGPVDINSIYQMAYQYM